MGENNKCPACGHNELGMGLLSGYSKVRPAGKLLSMGSDMIAVLCTKCGYVLYWKITSPKKFVGTMPKGKG